MYKILYYLVMHEKDSLLFFFFTCFDYIIIYDNNDGDDSNNNINYNNDKSIVIDFLCRLDFDSSIYPHLDHQANMTHATSVNETNTSMHMKALALKYFTDEQLTDIACHKQESPSFMLGNMQGSDISLATMHYLKRYQLLPGKNNIQAESKYQIMKRYSIKELNSKICVCVKSMYKIMF